MSKKDKLIQKIMALGKVTFKEAENLLMDLGYIVGTVGSHNTFRKKNELSITIVKRNPIHKDAVRDLRKIINNLDKEAS